MVMVGSLLPAPPWQRACGSRPRRAFQDTVCRSPAKVPGRVVPRTQVVKWECGPCLSCASWLDSVAPRVLDHLPFVERIEAVHVRVRVVNLGVETAAERIRPEQEVLPGDDLVALDDSPARVPAARGVQRVQTRPDDLDVTPQDTSPLRACGPRLRVALP